MTPYYSDDAVTLHHGDCREVTEWLRADVLVTDPPYGIGWEKLSASFGNGNSCTPQGIAGDSDASARDAMLSLWGLSKPALIFGSVRVPPPVGVRQWLVFGKPVVASGLAGCRLPWRRNWEPIYVCGEWPNQPGTRSSIVTTRHKAAAGYSGYITQAGHSHAKPVDVLASLLEVCPAGAIADPFAGSGSTLVAAKQLGRRAIGIEIEERYCEIAARRLAQDVLDFGETA